VCWGGERERFLLEQRIEYNIYLYMAKLGVEGGGVLQAIGEGVVKGGVWDGDNKDTTEFFGGRGEGHLLEGGDAAEWERELEVHRVVVRFSSQQAHVVPYEPTMHTPVLHPTRQRRTEAQHTTLHRYLDLLLLLFVVGVRVL